MNLLASKKSWMVAPAAFALCSAILLATWFAMAPDALTAAFDADGKSPVELMTLPLFALIIPLTWLCTPVSGSVSRKCFWNFVFTVLAVVALAREQDWHKDLVAWLWPDVVASFKGTVFKMRFLKAPGVPVLPKLFVAGFFATFFAFALLPLVRWIKPLFKGFFKLHPVSWTMAFFGGTSVMVMTVDRLPANLRHAGVAVSDSALALLKAFEEGGEAMMALFALLAILQAHAVYAPDEGADAWREKA